MRYVFMQIHVLISIWSHTWSRFLQEQSQATAVIGTTIDIHRDVWLFPAPWLTEHLGTYTTSDGSLKIKLKLTLTNLSDISLHSKAEEFQKASKDEVCQNLADLLDDKLSSDVKIRLKDNTELLAHKAILRGNINIDYKDIYSTY